MVAVVRSEKAGLDWLFWEGYANVKKKGQILADGIATVGGKLLRSFKFSLRQKALEGFIVIINTGPEGWNIGHLHF